MVATSPAPALTLSDFLYDLPEELIAQTPAPRREEARLMLVPRACEGATRHHQMGHISALARGDELFVFNDTRVVPARLIGHKPTGGRVELLVIKETSTPGEVLAMGRSSKTLRPDTPVILDGGGTAFVQGRMEGGMVRVRLPLESDQPGALWSFLNTHGHLPLPPYIHREHGPTIEDRERYQTVFARAPGSVAAPTAGLHFTEALIQKLKSRGCEITHLSLDVGPGTFSPVRSQSLSDHHMHSETFHLPEETAQRVRQARGDGRPVVAVGTTVVRTLEAIARRHGQVIPIREETDIFIKPGWSFQVVDQLITNFHLPGSTLLMLVCAFAGHQRAMEAYGEAVQERYRFFSYGDGMWIR